MTMDREEMRFLMVQRFMDDGLPEEVAIPAASKFMSEFDSARPEFSDPEKIRSETKKDVWAFIMKNLYNQLKENLRYPIRGEYIKPSGFMNPQFIMSPESAEIIAKGIIHSIREDL
jgi:hypothetical protein